MKLRGLLIIATFLGVLITMFGCGGNSGDTEVTDTIPTTTMAPFSVDTDQVVHHLPTHVVPGRLKNIFNDSNHVQLPVAQTGGFEPITTLHKAFHLNKPIVKIETCEDFTLDSLRHSMPFLVPKAAQLLHDIGRAFSDTIRARGGKEYRIRVTSLTRSTYSVSKLQRRNIAATTQSCHLYGTTFDISWVKFDCLDPSFVVSLEDLKNILAEIVYQKRAEERCYAKFEVKQGCFHITAR